MDGKWVRQTESDMSVVFVHGLLSSGDSCWLHENGTYWPALIPQERDLAGVGVYVFSYYTGIFSGTYRVSDVVDALKEHLRLDRVFESRRLVFVCHSMGGIVARKFIVERAAELMERDVEIGLFLIGSPSLGSSYAEWLSPIARVLGHQQAEVLRFTRANAWLADLDKEFQNLKEGERLHIKGKELVEDRFITLPAFWHRQVVEPFSGARYFGEPFKVPASDHFSIAKPSGRGAIQHRLLVQFITELKQDPIAGDTVANERTRPSGIGAPPERARESVLGFRTPSSAIQRRTSDHRPLHAAIIRSGNVAYTRNIDAAFSAEMKQSEELVLRRFISFTVDGPADPYVQTDAIDGWAAVNRRLQKIAATEEIHCYITIGTQASEMVAQGLGRHFGTVPFVFLGVTDPVASGLVESLRGRYDQRQVGGVAYCGGAEEIVSKVRRLFPDRRLCFVYAAGTPQDEALAHRFDQIAKLKDANLAIIKLDEIPAIDDLADYFNSRLLDRDAVYFSWYSFDRMLEDGSILTMLERRLILSTTRDYVMRGLCVAEISANDNEIGTQGARILVDHLSRGRVLGSVDVFQPTTVYRLNLDFAAKKGIQFADDVIRDAEEVFSGGLSDVGRD